MNDIIRIAKQHCSTEDFAALLIAHEEVRSLDDPDATSPVIVSVEPAVNAIAPTVLSPAWGR